MKYFLVFLFLSSTLNQSVSSRRVRRTGLTFERSSNSGHTKIIGGEQVATGQAPYQVAIIRNGAFHCGGALIGPTKKRVLTAAHCVVGYENTPSRFKVRYGTLYRTSGTDISVTRIIRHPSYNSSSIDYDVAILCLEKEFTPGINAAVVQLSPSTPAPGTAVTVTGWGRIHSTGANLPLFLQKATNLTTMSQQECRNHWIERNITDRMLCAFSTLQSSCTGDSGGPMVTRNNLLVGIVSWGSTWCLHPTHPGVYANVANLHSWIETTSETADDGASNSVTQVVYFSIVAINPFLVSSLLYNYFAEMWFS